MVPLSVTSSTLETSTVQLQCLTATIQRVKKHILIPKYKIIYIKCTNVKTLTIYRENKLNVRKYGCKTWFHTLKGEQGAEEFVWT
jgi:hypothetical protein